MVFEYRVFHGEESKSKVDAFMHPFTEERVLLEYGHFPTALDLHYSGTSVKASSVPAKLERDCVLVTLITDLPEAQADKSLVQLLVNLNKQIPGLCLDCERLGR